MIAISSLYLLAPLKTQIYDLLHGFSHSLSLEDHHGQPHHDDDHTHNEDHDHGFLSPHSATEKHHHGEEGHNDDHTHELLSFLSSVFDTDNGQDNDEKYLFASEYDKHILPHKSEGQTSFFIIEESKIWSYTEKVYGYCLEIKAPPPKVVLT